MWLNLKLDVEIISFEVDYQCKKFTKLVINVGSSLNNLGIETETNEVEINVEDLDLSITIFEINN
jgi:hypothetical protein